jgi:hypothetical protein
VLLDLSGGVLASTVAGWADRVDLGIGAMADEPYAGILLRPDGYVAWAADARGAGEATGGVVEAADLHGLRSALERWFGPAA